MVGATCVVRYGNTPACAGKTWGEQPVQPLPREHPRVRGEDTHDERFLSVGLGTPPRARGRPSREREAEVLAGNTPACAGKTLGSRPHQTSDREHPRVRGEDSSAAQPSADRTGTPPRARGRPNTPSLGLGDAGNTPACAGKTACFGRWLLMLREHPRVRGEDDPFLVRRSIRSGTPPRARGRHHGLPAAHLPYGNTPACAGKTWNVAQHWSPTWEHPRVRGEDVPGWFATPSRQGTPPRARGRLVVDPTAIT